MTPTIPARAIPPLGQEGTAFRLIDTHCHPQFDAFDDDRDVVIERALHHGIGLVAIGTTLADSLAGVKLAERYPDQPVWAAVGIHPTDEHLDNIHPAQLHGLLGSKKIVAIGECGLDYFHVDDPDQRDLQADILEQHILLAAEANLPLVVHCRDKPSVYDAYDHIFTLLSRHRVRRFVMHCYSGDWAQAEKFLELGGLLSFTATVGFPKSEAVQEVVKKTPADRMMVETDAPFLAPEPHRGKRNEPAYVELVAKKVAQLRGQDLATISKQLTDTTTAFFNLA